MLNETMKAIKILLVLVILTGLIYPLFIHLVANTAFSDKANGSMIKKDGKIIGSELIGQKFVAEKYFWGRPSAVNNNPMPSGGSNLSATSQKLIADVAARKDTLKKYNNNNSNVPKDLLFASASGVDPDISPEAAIFQIDRISKTRNFNDNQKNELKNLVTKLTENRQLGFLGEVTINVLKLNLELDKIK